MFKIHCNKCFKYRDEEADVEFELTRCHHIVCGVCLSLGARSSTGEEICVVCEHPLQSIAIGPDMPSNVANYFEDPRSFLDLFKKISKFQAEQFVSHSRNLTAKHHKVEELLNQLESFVKLEKRIRKQIKKEKQRLVEVHNYVAYYEGRNEVMLLDGTIESTEITEAERLMSRPRTPSISDGDSLTDTELELLEKPFKL